jgi:hypothetical protein
LLHYSSVTSYMNQNLRSLQASDATSKKDLL